MPGVAAAYTATGSAWQAGPGRIYDRLSEIAVGRCPVDLTGATVVDVGAGTGAASRAALAAGAALAFAVDSSIGMLVHDAADRPPATAGDATALPFASASVDAVVAAFSLNHLRHPAAGLAEARRVTRPGGAVVASSYSEDDGHPVKAAVEGALRARGWELEPWYAALKAEAIPKLATVEVCVGAARAAGLRPEVAGVRVPFPELDAAELVAWRLGMAHHAPFVARLTDDARAELAADAVDRLGGGFPALERSIIIMTAVV